MNQNPKSESRSNRKRTHTCAPKKLRTLDGLEEYFWLSENTSPRTTMTVAEVEGPTTVEAWREALRKVQNRYPLLSAQVGKVPGERPYFETLPQSDIPLRVLPLEGTDLDKLISQEPVISFAYADTLLARVTLCHSPQRSAVLLSAHHVATDGRTNVQIMQDLIAAVSGEELGDPLPLLPAIGEFLGLGEPGPYSRLYPAKAPTLNLRAALPSPKVQRHLLLANDLKALRSTAKAEGTTVQGALIAAFFLAGRQLSERWRTSPVVCLSPIDLRPMLNLYGAAGPIISVHPSVMQPSDNLPFWDFARELKQNMLPSQTREVAALAMDAVRQVVLHEGDQNDPNSIDPGGFYNHHLMISNYGDAADRTTFGHLTLKSLYPSVISGNGGTQTISVLTLDGALHVTHVSREPLPSLVEDAFTILRDASAVLSVKCATKSNS